MATLLRRTARLAGALAGLLLIGFSVLHMPAVRGRVLDRARVYAERELGVMLGASSLRYNLFRRSIELRELSLASAGADQPFLNADRAVVVVGPGILRGQLTITHISLDRPRVTLVRYADGSLNLPTSRSSSEPTPLQLGVVSVTGLSLQLDDRAAQQAFALGPFDLSIDTAGRTGGPGSFGPGPFSIRAGQTALTGTLGGRLGFDGARVTVQELTAQTPQGRVVLGGWADVIAAQPLVSARANVTVNITEAARLARVDTGGVTGALDGTITVTGQLAAPAIALTVAGRDIAHPSLGRVTLAGRSSFSGTRVTIESLDISAASGALHADGAIDTSDASQAAGRASRLAVRWSDLRLDDLDRALGRILPVPSGSTATGSGTLEFDTRDLMARAWSRLRATAATTLRALPGSPGRESAGLAGRADLQLDRGRWSLRHSLQASRHGADLTGTVTGRLTDTPGDLGSALGGRSRLRVTDLAQAAALLQAAGVALPPAAVDGLSGSVDAVVNPSGTVAAPRAGIELAARDLRVRLLPHPADVDARLDVDADGLRAHQVRATSLTTSVQASGRYSWRGPFDARVEATQGDLAAIASQFGAPVAISGSARLEGTVSGTLTADGRRGQAVLALTARDLVVEQVAIGSLAANGTLALADGGLMVIDATAPDVGARAHAEIVNRSGYPVSGEVTLDHDGIGALIPPQYRQQIGDVSGKLSAAAKGSGLLSDPTSLRGRIDLRQLDAMVRGTHVALAAPGTVTIIDDRIDVNAIDLRVGQRIRLMLGGQLGVRVVPDAETLRLHLDAPLSELIDVASKASGAEPVPVLGDGKATLDLAIGGTLTHPRPAGTLAVQSPSLGYGSLAPVTGLTLAATIDPTLITLQTSTAQWQGASVRADGQMPWRVVLESLQDARLAGWMAALPPEPGRARLTLRADNITQAALTDVLAPDRLRNIQGAVSASVVAEADRLSLERVQATAVLERAALTLAGVPFVQSVPTRLRLENGRATIDDFRWTAEGNSIVAKGEANVAAARPSIDVGITGGLDLRVLSAFVSGVASAGTAHADLRFTGPLDDPDIVGNLVVADGELQLDSPRIAASDLAGTLRIDAGRKVAVSLSGLVNTGNARLEGTLDLAQPATPLGKLQLTGRGVALESPPGLQTESNADLELVLGTGGSTLTGRIDVLGGTYREPLVLSSQLLRLSSTSGVARAAPPAEWLSRVRLNVSVATVSDLRIDNNYGRLDVGASVRVVGTAASPGVLGRVQAADGGEIYLGGNTYRVERLVIDLTNPRTITPDVNFSAQTRIGDLPINVELRCPGTSPCERKVTSLATGIDDTEAEARLFGTAGGAVSAGESLARLLSGELLGVVGRTVGLDAVRLEQAAERRDIFDDPTLIAGDVDPAARLTLAKRVGSNVELVFSQNLADDGFTWITSYFGPYGLSWRFLVLDDQSRAYEFRHEPALGAERARRRPRPPGPRIAAVRIAGTPGFPESEVLKQLRLGEGDRFTFAAWQRDRDRLARFYQTRGHLEARIRARQLPGIGADDTAPSQPGNPGDAQVVLEYAITRGPATQLIIRGTALPDTVRDRIVQRWTSALFDGFLQRDASAIVRDHLYREGYLQATVSTAIALDASRDAKTLTIEVVPGVILPSRLEVAGNSALPGTQLIGVVEAADPLAPWIDPPSVERLLENYCRAEGFLNADVSVGAPETRDGSSVVTITVSEGSPYLVGEIGLSGVPPEPGLSAREALGLSTGERYRPAAVIEGVDRLEGLLRRAAYREARIDVDTRVEAKGARVDIALAVTPGPKSILRDVVVQGADATKPQVARAIVLAPGTPLDPTAIRETRRRLYDLDVFRSVDIAVQPVSAEPPPVADGAPVEQPVTARITLGERPRYRFRYGLALTEQEIGPDERDRRLGVAVDFENRNIFGRGASAGVALRLRRDQQVGRLTLGANRLFGLPIRSTVFVERERELINPDGEVPITSDITSLTAEQAYRVRRAIELRYGYGIERNHTFIRTDVPDPFDLTVTIARFTTSGLIDRRDDPFNPGRGWFTASTLELSRPGLGSDLRFLKQFSQYSHFVPIGRGAVVASAARLGLARTYDDEVLIPSERFFAGGANTVRGYREDDLGERSIFDDAEGGSALLVLNGELRFPIYRWLKGVGFVDLGNVYPKVSDISLADLQIGLGAGARLDTPFGLVRFDIGVPANRRSFDPRWRIHFGLGHAF